MNYLNTPHSATVTSPAERMFGRPLRTRLDFLQPTAPGKTLKESIATKFQPGQLVMARDYRAGQAKWQQGIVEQRIGSYLYLIRSANT